MNPCAIFMRLDEMSPPGNAAEILSTQHEVMQKYLDLGIVFVPCSWGKYQCVDDFVTRVF